jgi:ketosteroid isomerase-like protein
MSSDKSPFLVRLQQATNNHDLDALADCFTADYRNDAPAHPGRSFQGTVQVRSNWQQIFRSVPDVRCRVLSQVVDGSQVWSEWEMSGTRPDGTQHLMRGVIVFGLRDGRAESARFYLEPVDQADTTVDDAVRAQVHADNPT